MVNTTSAEFMRSGVGEHGPSEQAVAGATELAIAKENGCGARPDGERGEVGFEGSLEGGAVGSCQAVEPVDRPFDEGSSGLRSDDDSSANEARFDLVSDQ